MNGGSHLVDENMRLWIWSQFFFWHVILFGLEVNMLDLNQMHLAESQNQYNQVPDWSVVKYW